MRRAGWFIAALAAGFLVFGAVGSARAEDADTLMSSVFARFRDAKTEREESEIFVIASPQEGAYTREQVKPFVDSAPSNVKHKRAVREAAYDVEGFDKTHVLFSLPAEDAGLSLLVFSGVREASDRTWLYMPGYRSVRQIPASSTQRFADTDFLYEDVRSQVGDRMKDFDYRFDRTEDRDGRSTKVVTATPKDGTTTAYGKRIFWIDSEWLFPVRVELYDQKGELWKILTNAEVKPLPPGLPRAHLVEMLDLQRKSATVLMVSNRALGVDIPPQVFTQDYLQHPDAK